jgi:ribonucleoside-triphosphate reductase
MSGQRALPDHLKDVKIPWGPIGEPVYKRTYSHEMENGRKEQWPDTVLRTVDGNLGLVDPKFIEPDERNKLLGLLLLMESLPAGRHLSASGRPGRQFLFNCHAAGWDAAEPSAHFSFLFDELMQGGGVGSNYSNRYLKTLPPVSRAVDLHIICRDDHENIGEFSHLLLQHNGKAVENVFTVPDTREGWVEAIDILTRVAFGEDAGFDIPLGLPEATVTIDISLIRKRGELLKTSGGIACGPGPLVSMLVDYVKQLNSCFGRHLTSLDAMMLDHLLASCVIAGGKRRSSRMSVKSWMDQDIFNFINCKREDGAHWSTNISVELDDDFFDCYYNRNAEAAKQLGDRAIENTQLLHEHARRVMRAIILGKRSNGEPGTWNRSLAMKGEREPELMFCPNPCGEIGLHMWENCNLGHINLEAFAPRLDGSKPVTSMGEAFRLMARWLVRATFGDVPQRRQQEVMGKNRRIGVGFFGYHAWLALYGIRYSDSHENAWVRETLNDMHLIVREAADQYADQMHIPRPVQCTTLAPTGTTVLLPGTTSSAQALTAPWFKRLVRYASMDPELHIKKLEGYETIIDEDAKNTEIVVYWCEDPLVAKVRAIGFEPQDILESQYDVKLQDSLAIQAMLQEIYVDNSISFTINMRPEDMPTEEEMESQFMEFLPRIKGTTFFPEKSRKNSPIQPLTKEEFDAYQGRKEITMVESECRTGCPVK